MYAPDGTVVEFDDGNGAFQKQTEPGGAVIEVKAYHADGFHVTQVERTYTTGGTTTTEQLNYEYNAPTYDAYLSTVTLRRKVNSGAWTNVSRANYVYYGYQETHGGEEDLKTVVTQTWDGSAWQSTGTTYYRYYPWFLPSSSSSSSSGGSGGSTLNPQNHLLKYVLDPASYARMVANGYDPLSVSDSVLALYADHYFEYDTQRRVTKEMVQGASQTFLFSYTESGFTNAVGSWQTKTVETLPDGTQNIVFTNYAGQVLLYVVRSGSDEWATFSAYDANFHLILRASPSAVSDYDETAPDLVRFNSGTGRYDLLRDNAGLIETFGIHAPSGYQSRESVQEGQLGSSIKLREREFVCCCTASGSSSSSSSSSSGCSCGVWYIQREIVYPSDTNQSLMQVTSYDYTFHPGTCAWKEVVTTLPVVSSGENGTGVAASRREYFDVYGNLTWAMDERGFISRMSYDIPTGAITQQVQDVDTGLYSDVPAGWTTPSGGGQNLVTDFEHDDRGWIVQTLGPSHSIDLNGTATTVRRATWMVYAESSTGNETRTAQGYATGSSPSYTYTLVNPVSITKTDLSGKVQEQIQATRASTSGKLLPSDTFAQSSYTRWQTTQYTDCCIVASTRVYHTIPASGEGTEGTNYDETGYGYDVRKRRNRTVTPGGTITRTVIDARGLVTSTWIGTDDTGGTATDPSGGGASGNTMKIVTANVFDGGSDGGDGYLTQQTQSVTASDTRVTTFTYDFRGRRLTTDGEIDFYHKDDYDNLSRVVKSERYDTTGGGNLIARSETKYDARGRVYQTVRYAVDPSTGTVGNALTDNTWYDASGHVLMALPAGASLFTKTQYDSLGRAVKQFSGYTPGSPGTPVPGSVSADVILEQSASTYDAASNVIQSTQRQRYHNASTAQLGELQNPSSTPKARVTYAAMYPDALGRTQASANYGTNGGSSLSRPSTIPARSDTVLVTSQSYNAAGNMVTTTDPAGMKTCFEHDDAGRETAKILNCTSSSSSSSSSGPATDDVNVTVLTAYNADGNVASLTAVNAVTGNQVTQYIYGTTLADSELATSTLKRKEIYPDSVDSDDVIKFTYNRQQQVTTVTDQQGTVHSYDFDKLGRPTQDRVTTLGSGVDNAVRRIATTYEVRGMKQTITSHDNATVGSGSVLNQCQFVYNAFGQLITEYQSHGGTVNTSTTPKVQYTFANGSANTIRPTGMVYPNGRTLSYDYGTSGGVGDKSSRIASIIDDDNTHLCDYQYLGRQTFVEQDDTEPQMKWTLIDLAGSNDPDTGDIYTGLDRFGRVKDNRWYNYNAAEDVDRIQYGYDRASNRIWRKNVVAAALGKQFDELYTYDGVHRLKDMVRGTLNGGHTALTSETFAESWTLDSTGNWRGFKQDDNGNGTWDLIQSRTANPVNEITDIAESVGPSWVTPAYNRAGNMTTMPQPANPTASYTATYDAWNRLVKIADGADTVSEYAYDGAKRRLVQKTYDGGVLNETRHLYYTEPSLWQVIEERVGTSPDSTSAEHQFVWGKRYVDELIVRDRDTDANGTLNERLYACQDANWNVTAITDSSGVPCERYSYSAYGLPFYVDIDFGQVLGSTKQWEHLYASYRFDASCALYNIRIRTYSPQLGVWLQRDPIGLADGPNLYAYVGCHPLTFVDPLGLQSTFPLNPPADPLPPWLIPVLVGGIQSAIAYLRALLLANLWNAALAAILLAALACLYNANRVCVPAFQSCQRKAIRQARNCRQTECRAGFREEPGRRFFFAAKCENRYRSKFLSSCTAQLLGCAATCGISVPPEPRMSCQPRMCNDLCNPC